MSKKRDGRTRTRSPSAKTRSRGNGDAGLTPEMVLDAASDIVETEGAEALTMRRLAGSLGVAPPTIYWHIGNKDELVEQLLRRLADDLGEITPVGRTPHKRIKSVMTGLRDQVNSHSALAALAWRRGPRTSMFVKAQQTLLAELRKTGLSSRRISFALHNLLTFYAGFHFIEHVLLERETRSYHPEGPATLASMLDDLDPELTKALTAGADIDEIYDFQLDTLIDGLLALAR